MSSLRDASITPTHTSHGSAVLAELNIFNDVEAPKLVSSARRGQCSSQAAHPPEHETLRPQVNTHGANRPQHSDSAFDTCRTTGMWAAQKPCANY